MALHLRNDDLRKEPLAGAHQFLPDSDQVRGHDDHPHHNPVGFPQERRIHNTVTPGADNFSNSAAGGVAGIAYGVAGRASGFDGASPKDLPPPPSQAHLAAVPRSLHPGQPGSYVAQDPNITSSIQSGDSYSNLDLQTAGDRYHFYTNPVSSQPAFDALNAKDIIDDGDDSLGDHQSNQASTMSAASPGRAPRVGAWGAASGAGAAGGAVGGALHRGAPGDKAGNHLAEYDLQPGHPGQDSSATALAKEEARNKRKKWIIIIIVFLIIAGAIVGGVVGGLINNSKKGGKEAPTGSRGGSGSGGTGKGGGTRGNGGAGGSGLTIHSPEISSLLGNKKLSKVFPGMDYTPLNTQYPACLIDPPSQDDITKDVAVLSQLTNKIRLYGTDCNQTEMVLYAISQLEMKDTVKVWLGVWQDNNSTTNQRQLDQMWTILDNYGPDPFEGIIVANEALFREQLTITTLGALLDDVRTKAKAKNINLPVATSDLGDNWKAALAAQSDLIMANVHPFFSGTPADKAAAWTWNFWHDHDGLFWKSDKTMNIIAETGWPSDGGTDCGGPATCTDGAVAGINEMNRFMDDWVCQALENGTNYFWFEAFDEPWKVQYNEPGKEWEDKWGLMDADRNLKDGLKIPTCEGKTVD